MKIFLFFFNLYCNLLKINFFSYSFNIFKNIFSCIGPIIWFQKFEYAMGHWLQKSTEHTIGSVLCSPGCFSLFRIKALMQHNVIAKYATKSTEPRHYIQYDQGEDRWLCTLILQAGCKVKKFIIHFK